MSDTEKKDKKPPVGKKSRENGDTKPNFFEKYKAKTNKWFREMRSELKKVVWPTRQQVINNSTIVITAVIIVGAIIAIFDFATSMGIQALIGFFV